jgi:hypothetical protein
LASSSSTTGSISLVTAPPSAAQKKSQFLCTEGMGLLLLVLFLSASVSGAGSLAKHVDLFDSVGNSFGFLFFCFFCFFLFPLASHPLFPLTFLPKATII